MNKSQEFYANMEEDSDDMMERDRIPGRLRAWYHRHKVASFWLFVAGVVAAMALTGQFHLPSPH